ncbi:endonuclease III [bacterium]|nr:endonuclease III [bacterium]
MGRLTQRARIQAIYACLTTRYPDVSPFLHHASPFQLLIAVILSAQCTDQRVNQVTPGLFERFPTPMTMAMATQAEMESLIGSITYYKTKARHCIQTAQQLMAHSGGEVPATLDELSQLPGVGRKTANVVLGQAFGVPGITVDTHVKRVSHRLGMSKGKTPEQIEKELQRCWPRSWWIDGSTRMILHGRTYCMARSPRCGECPVNEWCPTHQADRKKARTRSAS